MLIVLVAIIVGVCMPSAIHSIVDRQAHEEKRMRYWSWRSRQQSMATVDETNAVSKLTLPEPTEPDEVEVEVVCPETNYVQKIVEVVVERPVTGRWRFLWNVWSPILWARSNTVV